MNFGIFDWLTEHGLFLLTRAKQNTVCQEEQLLHKTARLHDRIVRVGRGAKGCQHPLRLVEMLYQGQWYRYLTNVLDPAVLPAEYVVALYRQRWRIEDAFNIVKRLLGLAYFWVGSQNGIQTQVWATWLLYAVLVDLTDEVATVLDQPFQALSLEMVYRGLYHFTQAYHRGQATDPVAYLAANAQHLGILKRRRRQHAEQLLLLTPSRSP